MRLRRGILVTRFWTQRLIFYLCVSGSFLQKSLVGKFHSLYSYLSSFLPSILYVTIWPLTSSCSSTHFQLSALGKWLFNVVLYCNARQISCAVRRERNVMATVVFCPEYIEVARTVDFKTQPLCNRVCGTSGCKKAIARKRCPDKNQSLNFVQCRTYRYQEDGQLKHADYKGGTMKEILLWLFGRFLGVYDPWEPAFVFAPRIAWLLFRILLEYVNL